MVQLMCVHMLQEAYEGLLLIMMRSLDLTLYAAAHRDAGHLDGLGNTCACTFCSFPMCAWFQGSVGEACVSFACVVVPVAHGVTLWCTRTCRHVHMVYAACLLVVRMTS
jgi:hypothetical protein